MSVKENQLNVEKFDVWAKSYDQGRMREWFTNSQTKTLEALEFRENDWLLDVGCGTGWAVMQAAQQLPEGKACGVDISPGMISQASEVAEDIPNTEFHVADAEAIPYPDDQFAAVMCTNSFHHYSSPVAALTEMRRVLKPGGRLIIRDMNRSGCWWTWLWDRFNRMFEKGHVLYYRPEEVFQFLSEADIKQAELISSEHSHFKGGKVGSAIYVIRAKIDKR